MTPESAPYDLAGLKHHRRGKVREVFDLGDCYAIVATDRVSAYDVVIPTDIPDKGHVLTALSDYWFGLTTHIVPNHCLTANPDEFPDALQPHRELLKGRTMVVKKAEVFPVECVVRGYLVGSGWKEYQQSGTVCGLTLPKGLLEGSRLPEPIFTPASKAEMGDHDENIPFEQMEGILGRVTAQTLRALSLALYRFGLAHAKTRGLILADTKFEFGTCDEIITLIDEVMTPDSSRYWPADGWAPGGAQPSFDKQFVRDHLDAVGWDHSPPAPPLPSEVVSGTTAKYRDAYLRITGEELPDL
jgi:phosphoribosylaminoimidazole-succinocarboxamide synthase